MLKTATRVATGAAIVLAAGAPTAAYARFDLNPVPSHPAAAAPAPAVSAAPSETFHWDDAGIGAAGALVLVGVGSGTLLARRRRPHGPLAG
jgi:hypothetical protein